MIGLDSNILLRLILKDDLSQAEAALRYLDAHCTPESPGVVNHIVLVEVCWTLRSVYKLSPHSIMQAVHGLLNNAYIHIPQAHTVKMALAYAVKGADFADALIALINHELGADYTITFDRAAAKLPEFKRLK